jgi:hypothetical protein
MIDRPTVFKEQLGVGGIVPGDEPHHRSTEQHRLTRNANNSHLTRDERLQRKFANPEILSNMFLPFEHLQGREAILIHHEENVTVPRPRRCFMDKKS